ncbi:MAG: MAC/perforin domain-containing protein [Oscillospiraceae bacterium]|nr:MAC/perforin domain-containing protein [Oscillospiraceae bacterium]
MIFTTLPPTVENTAVASSPNDPGASATLQVYNFLGERTFERGHLLDPFTTAGRQAFEELDIRQHSPGFSATSSHSTHQSFESLYSNVTQSSTRRRGVNVGIGSIFRINSVRQLTLSNNATFASSYETLFHRTEITRPLGFNTVMPEALRRNRTEIWEGGMLRSDFMELLANGDPAVLFERYGTHLLSRFGSGVFAEYMQAIAKTSSSTSESITRYFNIGGGANVTAPVKGATVAVGVNASRAFQYARTAAALHSDFEATSHMAIHGGETAVGAMAMGDWSPDTVSAWVESVTPTNAAILLDDSLRFIGVWELLPPGYELRRYELARAFVEASYGIDNEFFNRFFTHNQRPVTEGYVRLTIEERIANGDLPADVIRISTPTELSRLSGRRENFVLTNDIVLTGTWTPINNFNGLLDGNGFTISGLNVGETNANNRVAVAGLFGTIQNNMTIRNLHVEIRPYTTFNDSNGLHSGTPAPNNGVRALSDGSTRTRAGGLIGEVTGGAVRIENSSVSGGMVFSKHHHGERGGISSRAYAGGFIGTGVQYTYS